MKRMIALGLASLSFSLVGCSTIDKINPFSASPKSKVSPLVSLKPGAELTQRWRAGVGSSATYTFTPSVIGGSVYAASADGAVARFDNGSAAWKVSVGQKLSGGVGSDGTRVVVGTAKGEIITLDAATGKELWRAKTSSEVLAAPVVADGLVVARSGDARIFGFEAADGKRRWVYQRSAPTLTLRSNVGVIVGGGKTIAGFPGGKLVALSNSNGAALWEATVALPRGATELERVTDITSEPVVSTGLACAVAFQGKLACFDLASGNGVWSRDFSSSVGVDADDKNIYLTDDKGIVNALALSTGATVWRQDQLSERGVGRPLSIDKRVAVADAQGYVHLLSKEDGSLVARGSTDGTGIRAAMRQLANGLLAQTADGNLYSFDWRE